MHHRRYFAVMLLFLWLVSFWPTHTEFLVGMTKKGHALLKEAETTNEASAVEDSSAPGKILYIQMVRYKSQISAPQINELLESLQSTFSHISQIKRIRVGRIVDDSRQYDYAIVMEFDNMNDLHSYANSPIHRQWVQSHNSTSLALSHMTLTIQTGLHP